MMFTNLMYRMSFGLAFGPLLILSCAVANEAPQEVLSPAAQSGTHCVIELAPVADGAKASAATNKGCFDTFSAAIGAATKGAVALPPSIGPDKITEADIGPAAVIIGIDYDGFNYVGASFTWTTANPNGCFFGNAYIANEPGFFNNRLSSTRGFSGCNRNRSFDGFNRTGSFVTCFPDCTLQGFFMNNRTSSKRWWRQ